MKSPRTPAKAADSTTLLVAMTGKASPAKAAEGDEPVFAYIASLPQPQRGIAERIDALAAEQLSDLRRAVKWGMAYYGVGEGWCFSSGAFVGHVKLMFIRGTELEPEPPVTPVGMGKSTRGVELASVDIEAPSGGTPGPCFGMSSGPARRDDRSAAPVYGQGQARRPGCH